MYYTRHRTNIRNPVCNSVHPDKDGLVWIMFSIMADIRNPVCNSVHPDKDGLVWIMFSIGGHFHFW